MIISIVLSLCKRQVQPRDFRRLPNRGRTSVQNLHSALRGFQYTAIFYWSNILSQWYSYGKLLPIDSQFLPCWLQSIRLERRWIPNGGGTPTSPQSYGTESSSSRDLGHR